MSLLPLISVIGGSLLAFVLVVFIVVSTYGTNIPEEAKPGIAYTVPISGDYYVEVKDTAPGSQDYLLWVVKSSSDVVSPDFSQTSVWPTSYEQHIFSRVAHPQQHLYRVEGNVEETIVVNLDYWYADDDLDFTLLNSEMDECDTASLLESDLDNRDQALGCVVASTGPHYIRVQLRESSVGTSSKYGFKVYQVLESAEKEPNNDSESSTEIPQGALVTGTLSALDRDWYRFTAEAGQQLEITASGLSDSTLSSLMLYKPITSGYDLVAHSTSSLPAGPEFTRRVFKTSRGRAYFASDLLSLVGIRISPTRFVRLVQIDRVWVVYLLLSVSFFGYFIFVSSLSQRKYDESTAISYMVDVLVQLGDDDALRSEGNKARIRSRITFTAGQVRKIHRISRFPVMFAAPGEMEKHLAKIASQITHMNAIVSIPGTETLPYLRQRFAAWLGVFLKAEYGEFQFTEGFQPVPTPWHRQIGHSIQRHWWKIAIVIAVASILMFLSRPLWSGYSVELLAWAWLAARYIILIVAVCTIYDRWGFRGPSEQQESKWQNAVRLILFFFVPFFALDVLLQTGIVDKIIELVGKLEIF